jgi:hypothetical protein
MEFTKEDMNNNTHFISNLQARLRDYVDYIFPFEVHKLMVEEFNKGIK